MEGDLLDTEAITVELTEEELAAIERKAFRDHRENTDAAIRDLLDEWLKSQ